MMYRMLDCLTSCHGLHEIVQHHIVTKGKLLSEIGKRLAKPDFLPNACRVTIRRNVPNERVFDVVTYADLKLFTITVSVPGMVTEVALTKPDFCEFSCLKMRASTCLIPHKPLDQTIWLFVLVREFVNCKPFVSCNFPPRTIRSHCFSLASLADVFPLGFSLDFVTYLAWPAITTPDDVSNLLDESLLPAKVSSKSP